MLSIVQSPDPLLNTVCEPCDFNDKSLKRLAKQMAHVMYKNAGCGLAAPQVGVLKRVVVIDVGKGLLELINPEIVSSSGSQTGEEGCLSCGDVRKSVTRPMHVEVRALDRNGKGITIKAEELLARCCCHEIDHLDGILFLDRANPDEERS